MRPFAPMAGLASLIIFGLSFAQADTVTLKDGRSLKGKIEEKKDHIIITLKYGSVRIERKDIVSIIKDKKQFDPKTKPTPPPRKIHAPLPLPKQSRMTELRKIAGPEGFLLENPQFIIVGSGKKTMAKKLQNVIQKTYERFFQEFQNGPISLQKPKAKLEIILFPNEERFRRYTLDEHSSMIRNDGFFSRRDNRSYFYDLLHSKASQSAAKQRRPLEKDIEELEQRLLISSPLKATALRQRIKKQKRRLERYKQKQNRVLEEICLSTAAHEVTHQLCYNTKLIPITKGFPTWLLEGIALIFEELPQRKASQAKDPLGSLNPLRIQLLKSAHKERKKPPSLHRLLSHSGPLLDLQGHQSYAVTWALMHHILIRRKDKHKAQLFKYLQQANQLCKARKEKKRPISEKERSQLFTRSFQCTLPNFDKEFQETLKSLIGN